MKSSVCLRVEFLGKKGERSAVNLPAGLTVEGYRRRLQEVCPLWACVVKVWAVESGPALLVWAGTSADLMRSGLIRDAYGQEWASGPVPVPL